MSQSQSINLYFTEKDIERFKAHVLEIFKGKDVNFYVDNEIIGGFIIEDKENSIKFDLSILYRIHSSKDIIGEKLFEVLQ
jgi:vacuolar-type H+-ATPase subunit E/Vma4